MVRTHLSRDPVVFEELTCTFCSGRAETPSISCLPFPPVVSGGERQSPGPGAGGGLGPLPGNGGRQDPYLHHLRRQGLRPPISVANGLMSSMQRFGR
jgi:hypothetical protein